MHNIYHNITDWIAYTQHLNPLEEGILWRLICKQFYDESPLPSDDNGIRLLCRKLRINDQYLPIVYELLDEFFVKNEHGYTNSLYEGKLRDISRKSKSARERGKMGGRPKKENGKKEDNENNELQENDPKCTLTERKKLKKKLTVELYNEINDLEKLKKQPITHNPKPITQEPITQHLNASVSIFEKPSSSFNFVKFIESYPKPVDNSKKQKAANEWRYGKHEMHAGKILSNLTDRIAFSKWRDWIGTPEDKFIPDPANFLRNKIYDEEVERILTDEEKQDEFLNQLDL